MKRIGIIVAGSAYPMEGFKSGLRDLGWVDGESVCLEIRAAEGQLHLLPGFASELVGFGPDLIAVIGAVTVPDDDAHSDRFCRRGRADWRRIGHEPRAPR